MNEKIEVPTMKVPPLKKICMTIGQIPASYVETMSYYEMLVWFIHFLRDDIIPVVNANGEATRELQELYVELQEYVINYFDNLDVQEEINNKLDEMLENGQLEQIIEQFIQSSALWCFDNVADMIASTNLINGSYARTLGYYSVNDGGGCLYKISNSQTSNHYETLSGGLYANVINDIINIKQYGCYGDNTHDDSLIIKGILENLNNGDVIYVPKGTYKCETDISVTANDIRIYGDGQLNSTIDFNNNGSIIFNGHGVKMQNLRYTKQDKIELDSYHNTLNNVNIDHGDIGLLLKSAYITEVNNCYFTYNKVGTILDNQSFEVDFTDCVIDNNELGALIIETTGARFTNCTIEGNRNTTSTKGCGVAFSSANCDIQITGCWFESNGTSSDSADILSINSVQDSLFDDLISQIQSLYAFTKSNNPGNIILNNNHHAFTQYGIVIGGYLSNYHITNCYFTGTLNKNNKPIFILNRSNTIHYATLKARNNTIINTGAGGTTTTEEMTSGIKGSYIFTNAVLPATENQYLITTDYYQLDNEPLFVYEPYLKDLVNKKSLHQWQSGGTSYISGMLLGASTNSYIASSPSIYVNDDGTTSGGTNIFDNTGDTTYVFISAYGSTIQTRKDDNVPTNTTPIAEGLFPIKRENMYTRTAFVIGANSVHYMLIQLNTNEQQKSKQCVAMKPKDYYPSVIPNLS